MEPVVDRLLEWDEVAVRYQNRYPGGDPRLSAVQEVVFSWILSPAFLKPNWTRQVEGQPERVRRCASMEGNVIWASLQLGLMDDRLMELAHRLGRLQWPDGGWNCDVRPEARHSSSVETVLGLRELAAWVAATGDEAAGGTLTARGRSTRTIRSPGIR